MKEPPLSRLRKKPTNTIEHNTTSPSRKLKLVCSFNGAFHRRPPSNKLRYVGGETRIVSVDRNIGFLKLRSKISDLSPIFPSFSLRYQLPLNTETDTDADTRPLLIASDEDVKCMIEEYDKLELYGKPARLWLFVCNDNDDNDSDVINGVDKGHGYLLVDSVGSDSLYTKYSGVCRDPICGAKGFESLNCEANLCGGQSDAKEAKNLVNGAAGVNYGGNSLRNMILKQQLLANQSGRVNSIGIDSECGVYEATMERLTCDYPLIDLGPEIKLSQDDPHPVNMLECKLGKGQFMGSENYGSSVQYPGPRVHPLNPRDGNLHVESNRSMHCLAGFSGQVLYHGTGIGSTNSSQSAGQLEASKQFYNSGVVPMFNHLDSKQDPRSFPKVSRTHLNSENIMPWTSSCDLAKTSLAPLSFSNQWVGSAYPMKSRYDGERVWNGYYNGIRNHKFAGNYCRNPRNYPYSIRNHRNNFVKVGNHWAARLDGSLSARKCLAGLGPNSYISKQGHSVRLYQPISWKLSPGFPEHSLEQKVSKIDSGFNGGNSSFDVQYGEENMRRQEGAAVSENRISNLKECHFAYQGVCAGLADQSLLSCKATGSPSSRIGGTEDQKDLLNGSHSEMLDASNQTLFGNFQGVPINCDPILCDLKKVKFLVEPQKVFSSFGFSNNMYYTNETGSGCKTKLLDIEAGDVSLSNCGNDTHNFQSGVASSVSLLYNLSLSSSKEVEPPSCSSLASNDVCVPLLKLPSKTIDLMDGRQLGWAPQVGESHGVASDSAPQIPAKAVNDRVLEEEIQQDLPSGLSIDVKAYTEVSHKDFKVVGGICCDLTSFYTHLATRELQTIKNSDLEYIKELGSGTYGTVFYGKWKGSDVAIKKLKPCCFTDGSLDEDRLVADFWREAHILGQLHHPNIVAFYGVVTDGPVTNLATVTEYMVNGSLKQVLRRKDRTIDRRKRLIIAMDAVFGMEYLHEKKIVHFDIKSHNFLVNMRDPQRPVCKIGDLGLSKIKQRTLVSGGVRGTIPWMAPELLNSQNNMVTEKVDVYSFGIVMWELLTGEEPYVNMRSEEIIAGIIRGILRPEIPTWCDPAWRSLMERCWSSDPDSRPAFSEIAKELRAMSVAMNIK